LKSHAPSVSIVIPCYRHAEELAMCLTGLSGQEYGGEWEVLVVNSGADPEVAAAARRGGARLIESDIRLLPGQARNFGAGRAAGEVLAFIDADCVPETGWLESAMVALTPGARLVSGPVLHARPLHPIAVSDNLLQFADFPPNRPNGPARYFPGCNLAIRRIDFDAVGGFPGVTLPAGEDTSFSAAVSSRWPGGLQFTRRMRVRHAGRTTFKAYVDHHASFGYCRAALDLHLTPWQRRWGAHGVMGPVVALKRLLYILGRGLQWDRPQLARTLVLLPIVLSGLFAWTLGFQRGLRIDAGAKQ
jgi:glycosyltransferase involved in cell wall biosynthesis